METTRTIEAYCPACGGDGAFRYHDGTEEGYVEPCRVCDQGVVRVRPVPTPARAEASQGGDPWLRLHAEVMPNVADLALLERLGGCVNRARAAVEAQHEAHLWRDHEHLMGTILKQDAQIAALREALMVNTERACRLKEPAFSSVCQCAAHQAYRAALAATREGPSD